MKLNLEAIQDSPKSAADKLSMNAAQFFGQLMQLFGIATIEYQTPGKGYTPSDIRITPFSPCPEAVQEMAKGLAYYLCGLMHELNIRKLSYEYSPTDIASLNGLWEKAAEGVRSESLLVAPDVTPDMERIEIDL